MSVQEWLKSGKYLPKFMQDFHKQKRVFKRIDVFVENRKEANKDNILSHKMPDWVTAHIYVIDIFLWYMARHGYTLQKTRKRLSFEDIEEDLDAWEKWDRDQLFKHHPFYSDSKNITGDER
jgi:hypothetical protein